MKEQIIQAVNGLFAEYEDTPELRDFKEELIGNLEARAVDMSARGLKEKEVMEKLLDELGDVTEAADSLSRQKRNEYIHQAYANKISLDKTHSIGYPAAGAVLLFGLLIGALAGNVTGSITGALGGLLLFAVGAICAFVYLGLTQETRTLNPMPSKRAVVYTILAGVFSFGVLVSLMAANSEYERASGGADVVPALGVLLVFVLPAVAVFAYMLFTEKNRKKPWVLRMQEEQTKRHEEQYNAFYDEKFGLLSGAIWILGIGLFALIGLAFSWKYSWFALILALVGQLLLQYHVMSKNSK